MKKMLQAKIAKNVNIIILGSIIGIVIFLSFGCANCEEKNNNEEQNLVQKEVVEEILVVEEIEEKENFNKSSVTEDLLYYEYIGEQYTIIEVDGGDRSGEREVNVAVDIGYGEREYLELTNEYGQLVYVIADANVLFLYKNLEVIISEWQI